MIHRDIIRRLPSPLREDLLRVLPTLRQLARGFTHTESEDLFQMCLLAILESTSKYRGLSLRSTYYVIVARNAVLEYKRKQAARRKNEKQADLPVSLGPDLLPGYSVCRECESPYPVWESDNLPRGRGSLRMCETCKKRRYRGYYSRCR